MFITPYFGGCKYTNNFLFINKNIVFQHFGLLITFPFPLPPVRRLGPSVRLSADFMTDGGRIAHFKAQNSTVSQLFARFVD